MIEGLLCGLIGSVGAILLLVVGKSVVLPAPNWESDNSNISARVRADRARDPRRRAAARCRRLGADAAPVPPRLIQTRPLRTPRLGASPRLHPISAYWGNSGAWVTRLFAMSDKSSPGGRLVVELGKRGKLVVGEPYFSRRAGRHRPPRASPMPVLATSSSCARVAGAPA